MSENPKADRSYASSNGAFTDLLEQAPEATLVVDAHGLILKIGGQFKTLFGYSRSDLEGRSFEKLLPRRFRLAKDGDHMDQSIDFDIFRRQSSLRGVRESGTEFPIAFSYFPIDTLEGRHAIVTLRDISILHRSLINNQERMNGQMLNLKAANDSLEEGNLRYERVMDKLPSAFYTTDAKGVITYFNRAAAKLWGRRPVIGKDRWCGSFRLYTRSGKLIPHSDCPLALSIKQKRPVPRKEIVAQRPDGSRVTFIPQISQVRDSSGHIIGTSNILRDITQQKQIEHSLRWRDRLIGLSFDAILAWKQEGGIKFWSNGAARLYGHKLSGVLGSCPHKLLKSRFPVPWRELQVKLDSCGSWEGEVRRTTLSGEDIVVSSRIQIVPDGDNTFSILETSRDITDRLRLEREVLEVGAHERERIASDLHDDLGQWLMGTELLAGSLANDLKSISFAEATRCQTISDNLRIAATRLRTLVHGLATRMVLAEHLPDTFGQLAKDIEQIFGIHCVCQISDDAIVSDNTISLHLYRIAQEAITNAIRHGRAKKITIKLHSMRGCVRLEVQDNGKGISKHQEGTKGMGLKIMQYRAEAIGAVLRVSSTLDKGTTIACIIRNS